jgi:transcriptional regulator with XRE-family HTH domain
MSTINDRVAETITQSGRSQADLARAIGVSRATVNDWKNGRTKNLRMENLFALADALGISARWLAIGKGPKRDPMSIAPIRNLAQILLDEPPSTQRAFESMAASIAEERAGYRKAS